jgi:hypothetical protein
MAVVFEDDQISFGCSSRMPVSRQEGSHGLLAINQKKYACDIHKCRGSLKSSLGV